MNGNQETQRGDGPGAQRQPALFIGHGSPMNIIADNAYTQSMTRLGEELRRPQAVLVVSAHWLTGGTAVGSGATNPTIYDFFGFPAELYEKQYPAPGAPGVAARASELTSGRAVPTERGLDHAAWAPLSRIYPAADVPVLSLSLDMTLTAAQHYALGRLLRPLRDEGVLLMGSGNIVHDLQHVDWDETAAPAQWARDFDDWVAQAVTERRHDDLIRYLEHPLGRRAAPTADHFLPLLYTLAATHDDEPVGTVHSGIDHGTISMRCLRFGD